MESTSTPVTLLKPCTIWLTGLSGAGKTTVAVETKKRIDALLGNDTSVFLLDGDVVR